MLLNEARDDMIQRFLNRDFPKKGSVTSGNLEISKAEDGWNLINYSTVIAYLPNDVENILLFNSKKYSQTTKIIQNKILSFATNRGLNIVDCDENIIRKVSYSRLSEINEIIKSMIIWVFTEYNDHEWFIKARLAKVYQRVLDDNKSS